jgi:hypothetical protein
MRLCNGLAGQANRPQWDWRRLRPPELASVDSCAKLKTDTVTRLPPTRAPPAGTLMQWWLNIATILGWLLSSVFALALASFARST